MNLCWYYMNEKSIELGPFSPDGLRYIVTSGRITPATLVRKGETGKWVAAGKVRGLLVAAIEEVNDRPRVTTILGTAQLKVDRIEPGCEVYTQLDAVSETEVSDLKEQSIQACKSAKPKLKVMLYVVGPFLLAVLLWKIVPNKELFFDYSVAQNSLQQDVFASEDNSSIPAHPSRKAEPSPPPVNSNHHAPQFDVSTDPRVGTTSILMPFSAFTAQEEQELRSRINDLCGSQESAEWCQRQVYKIASIAKRGGYTFAKTTELLESAVAESRRLDLNPVFAVTALSRSMAFGIAYKESENTPRMANPDDEIAKEKTVDSEGFSQVDSSKKKGVIRDQEAIYDDYIAHENKAIRAAKGMSRNRGQSYLREQYNKTLANLSKKHMISLDELKGLIDDYKSRKR